MKLIMKLTIKLFLIVSLFATAAIAEDGHIPSGGFANNSPDNTVCKVYDDGHIPSGGFACEDSADDGHIPSGGISAVTNDPNSDNSILNFVKDYLFSLFG